MIDVTAFYRPFETNPVSYYRVCLPMQALQALHSNMFRVRMYSSDEVKAIIDRYGSMSERVLSGDDIYLVSRLFGSETERMRRMRDAFLDAVHDSGGKVVFDTDDDLTCDYRDLENGEAFKDMLRVVDAITVSTPFLADRVMEITGKTPTVLPNHIDVKWFADESLGAERKEPRLTIGLIGTASHYGDWHFVVPALRRIAEERDDVTLAVCGYVPDYLEGLEFVTAYEFVPYSKYPSLMRQLDVVCCALDPDDRFNWSKSSIKALEAMASARTLRNGIVGGAVAVCTDMPVYRRTVGNRHNGILTDNEHWYEALTAIVENVHLRDRISKAGYKWVSKHRNIHTGARYWRDAYKRIAEGG